MKKYLIFTLISCLTLIISCKKKPKAGYGGAANLIIETQHHGLTIDSAMVYIKFNAQDAPTDDIFDDSAKVQLSNGMKVATFNGLKKGEYYLFGKGWDPSINNNVKGGLPFIITDEIDQKIILPVTETH